MFKFPKPWGVLLPPCRGADELSWSISIFACFTVDFQFEIVVSEVFAELISD